MKLKIQSDKNQISLTDHYSFLNLIHTLRYVIIYLSWLFGKYYNFNCFIHSSIQY